MHRGLAAIAVTAALALPASAAAETRYVDTGGADISACTNSGAPCKTVNHAVAVASDGDTIQIAAGTYAEAATVTTNAVLTFVGAGSGTAADASGSTLIRGPDGVVDQGKPALELERGGTLRSIRVRGGDGDNGGGGFDEFGGDGIRFTPTEAAQLELVLDRTVVLAGNRDPGGPALIEEPVSAVTVKSGPAQASLSVLDSALVGAGSNGDAGAQNLRVEEAGARAEVIDSELGAGPSPGGSTGTSVRKGAEVTIRSSQLIGSIGAIVAEGSLIVERSEILGLIAAMRLQANTSPATVSVIDSQVAGGGLGIFELPGVSVGTSGAGGTASMTARGSTFAGAGTGAVIATEGNAASVDLRNSIAWHFPEEVPTADLEAAGGAITAQHSSFTTRVEKEGGTVTPPGSGANLVGDPQFVDVAAGNFALQATSPLIDRGDPSLVAPSQLDLAGNPRSLDGNRDCLAAPDIGAFELAGQAATCLADDPPSVSGFRVTNKVFAPKGKSTKRKRGRAAVSAKRKRRRVKRGTTFLYRLSEPARVRITIERKARGRKVRRRGKTRCVRPRRGKTKPRCVRFIKVGSLSAQKQAGRRSTRFSGRLRGKRLRPGRYRATIVATDAAGQRSRPRRVAFRVVRG
ncbi:MAG TPA: choice-of-anchor Q domain-containing protein [Solirubrobacterales bacterium]